MGYYFLSSLVVLWHHLHVDNYLFRVSLIYTMNALKKVGKWLAPPPETSEDGRDQWPSRTSFILASMGGCAGMGNLLRFPSQVYNNNGIQWFIPYLMAIFIIAIPVLVLGIAIGQAYRGGSVIAYNNINRRLKGVGLSLLYTAFVVGPYFVANLAWIMIYFRNSFKSPLPWTGRGQEFYMNDVVAKCRQRHQTLRWRIQRRPTRQRSDLADCMWTSLLFNWSRVWLLYILRLLQSEVLQCCHGLDLDRMQ